MTREELSIIIEGAIKRCFNTMTNQQVFNAVFDFKHLQTKKAKKYDRNIKRIKNIV
jgi:hypothetical protein